MPKDIWKDQPTMRRYSAEEKAAAVRMVRTLRAELGTTQGTVKRVAEQLGYGTESVRTWVKQADIDDGHTPWLCQPHLAPGRRPGMDPPCARPAA